jgi:hypothetical protein
VEFADSWVSRWLRLSAETRSVIRRGIRRQGSTLGQGAEELSPAQRCVCRTAFSTRTTSLVCSSEDVDDHSGKRAAPRTPAEAGQYGRS